MVHYGKGLISVFQGFFASISECFVSAGGGRGAWRWAFILWSLDPILMFPNFLKPQVLSRSATRIYHVYKS